MALNCEEKLSADIQKDCENKPIGGIEVNVVLIALKDINKTTSVISSTNKLLITDLATLSGTSGYFVEGIKQAQGAMFELVKKEDSFDAYKHSFSGVVLNPSASNKLELSKVASGERYVAVVEKKWKGADSDEAFEVLGWDSGLVISEMTWNTKESDGIIKFVLSNEDGYEEPEMTRTLLETDYATTKTSFNNKFATA
jgi:hypothetical protein